MPSFSLFSEPEKIHEAMFCDSDTKLKETCVDDICHCVHRLKVQLNAVVDFVLIDISDGQTHPFHLHGHKFAVLEMGTLNDTMTVSKIRSEGIPLNPNHNKHPVLKDTVLVPNKGYVRIRFRANNPGFWLAHCHFLWHMEIGMAFILQVGEVNQMKKPPRNFAKCQNYLPNSM